MTGLQLGLKSSVLDQVEGDYHTMSERFRVTLEKWLQLNVGVTWANLELAITNANRESLGLQPLTTGKENLCVHVYMCACTSLLDKYFHHYYRINHLTLKST